MNRKDTYRNYIIWALLLTFYGVFYYINHYAWVDEIDVIVPVNVRNSGILSSQDPAIEQDTLDADTLKKARNEVDENKTYVSRDPDRNKRQRPKSFSFTKEQPRIHINDAGIMEWQSLHNIGPYRAERIINFRKALGGFNSVAQVGETFGLPDSVFNQIKSQLIPDSTWKLIPINKVEYDSLYQHPYITKQMAYFMVRYRETTGPIHHMDALYELIKEKDHERLRKLEPYLDFGIK